LRDDAFGFEGLWIGHVGKRSNICNNDPEWNWEKASGSILRPDDREEKKIYYRIENRIEK
jgi:hypothetical protein